MAEIDGMIIEGGVLMSGDVNKGNDFVVTDWMIDASDDDAWNMSKRTVIDIPAGVTKIGEEAFGYFCYLRSVTIPEGVTEIEDYLFSWCTGLTECILPESVTSIGDKAFYGCTGLKSLTIPKSVTSIGPNAFKDCPVCRFYVPSGSSAEEYFKAGRLPYTAL